MNIVGTGLDAPIQTPIDGIVIINHDAEVHKQILAAQENVIGADDDEIDDLVADGDVSLEEVKSRIAELDEKLYEYAFLLCELVLRRADGEDLQFSTVEDVKKAGSVVRDRILRAYRDGIKNEGKLQQQTQ